MHGLKLSIPQCLEAAELGKMKYFLVLLVIVVVTSCQGAEVGSALAAQERSLSSMLEEWFEQLKEDMVEGWPEYGIPSLAPLEIGHKDFNLDSGEFSANGEVNNLVVRGLNEYEIVVMRVNTLRSRINFEFNFASLNATTQYETDVGSGYRMKRNGGAFLALENLNIVGQIRYSLSLISGQFELNKITISITVGKVASNIENLSKYRILNRKMNEVIEEFLMLSINDNTDFMAEWIDATATPLLNELIGDSSIWDLLGVIGGGSDTDVVSS